MFVDTSVVVAILSREDDADIWTDRLEAAPGLVTSVLVILEAVMRLSTKLRIEPSEAANAIDAFLREAAITIIPIGEAEQASAVHAFAIYGKRRGHPAQLNLADCLSYACASARGIPLLYKGDDFAHTDLA